MMAGRVRLLPAARAVALLLLLVLGEPGNSSSGRGTVFRRRRHCRRPAAGTATAHRSWSHPGRVPHHLAGPGRTPARRWPPVRCGADQRARSPRSPGVHQSWPQVQTSVSSTSHLGSPPSPGPHATTAPLASENRLIRRLLRTSRQPAGRPWHRDVQRRRAAGAVRAWLPRSSGWPRTRARPASAGCGRDACAVRPLRAVRPRRPLHVAVRRPAQPRHRACLPCTPPATPPTASSRKPGLIESEADLRAERFTRAG